VCLLSAASEEDLGSSEESGKDWDELEEEAKKGSVKYFECLSGSRSCLATFQWEIAGPHSQIPVGNGQTMQPHPSG